MEAQPYTEPVRFIMAGSLVYATYIVLVCPCAKPVACKQPQFYAATLLPVALTFFLNT